MCTLAWPRMEILVRNLLGCYKSTACLRQEKVREDKQSVLTSRSRNPHIATWLT